MLYAIVLAVLVVAVVWLGLWPGLLVGAVAVLVGAFAIGIARARKEHRAAR